MGAPVVVPEEVLPPQATAATTTVAASNPSLRKVTSRDYSCSAKNGVAILPVGL
jgi:hypothetical protein